MFLEAKKKKTERPKEIKAKQTHENRNTSEACEAKAEYVRRRRLYKPTENGNI